MDWKMLSSGKPQWLFFVLLFVWFVGSSASNARAQVYESTQNGYTIESIGSYPLATMTAALDQCDWDTYRKSTLPVTLRFDDGSVVTLHSASSRPNQQIALALPDQTVIATRTLSIAPSGAILMLHTSQTTK